MRPAAQRRSARSQASGYLATDTQQAGQNRPAPSSLRVPRERRSPFRMWLASENGSDPYEARRKWLYACWSEDYELE